MNQQHGPHREGIPRFHHNARLAIWLFITAAFISAFAPSTSQAKAQPTTESQRSPASPQEPQPIQANAEEAARLGVDKLFGSTRLRDFGGSPAFTPDGKFVVGFAGRHSKKINVGTGEIRRVRLEGRNGGGGYAISPDGQRVLTPGIGGISVWDVETGKTRFLLDPVDFGIEYGKAWSPDGKRAVTGYWNGFIRVYDTETGEIVATHTRGQQGQQGFTDKAAWSPGGRHYAVGGFGAPYLIHVYDAATHQEVRRIDLGLQRTIRFPLAGLEFMSDTQLITCSAREFDRTGERLIETHVKLWDVTNGKELRSFQLPNQESEPVAICLTPDRKQVVVRLTDAIQFVDLATGGVTKELLGLQESDYGDTIAVSPDGSMLVYGGQLLKLIDVASGTLLHRTDADGHDGFEFSSLSPDGKLIASCGQDGMAMFWDFETCTPICRMEFGTPFSVECTRWSPDSKRFYAMGIRSPRSRSTLTQKPVLIAFDAERKAIAFETEIPNHAFPGLWRLAIPPDSSEIIVGAGNSINANDDRAFLEYVDARTGATKQRLAGVHLNSIQQIAYSQDGKHLLITKFEGNERFQILDAVTGDKVYGEQGWGDGSGSFSADGTLFTILTEDGGALIYDTIQRRVVRTVSVPNMRIRSSSLRNTSDLLYTRSFEVELVDGEEQAVRNGRRETHIWDAATGVLLHTITQSKLNGGSHGLSPDGKYLLGTSGSLPAAWELERVVDEPE